jgi:site-specific recombinase XerD
MLEDLFTNRWSITRHREAPFGSYIDAFIGQMRSLGYSLFNMRHAVQSVRQYGLWLHRRKLGASHASKETINAFAQEHSSPSWIRHGGHAGICSLLNYLIQAGVASAKASVVDDSPLTQIEQEFNCYLRNERALVINTTQRYCMVARLFMTERFGSAPLELSKLSILDIHNFVSRNAQKHCSHRIQLILTALRSFLRCLYIKGHIKQKLDDHVPKVCGWRLSEIPRWIESDDIDRTISCCSNQTAGGKRNHAILLLLARLGLRAGEVVSLKLEDIRWEAGEISVCGKGRERKRFPLPAEVGRSLSLYLKKGRPTCASRHVFLRTRAPYREIGRSSSISTIVKRALKKAGLNPPRKGAHLFRHSLATNMLRKGATLNEIGQILHHKRPDTTAIYAKVDFSALQTLAQPWPGDRS